MPIIPLFPDKRSSSKKTKRVFCMDCISYKKVISSKGEEIETCVNKTTYSKFNKNEISSRDCYEFIKRTNYEKKYTEEDLKEMLNSRIGLTKEENIKFLIKNSGYSKKYIQDIYGEWKKEYMKYKSGGNENGNNL